MSVESKTALYPNYFYFIEKKLGKEIVHEAK